MGAMPPLKKKPSERKGNGSGKAPARSEKFFQQSVVPKQPFCPIRVYFLRRRRILPCSFRAHFWRQRRHPAEASTITNLPAGPNPMHNPCVHRGAAVSHNGVRLLLASAAITWYGFGVKVRVRYFVVSCTGRQTSGPK
ncbi:MAG: hypothetical protein AVDCRST_MAG56-7770 [uncultured Cytophagales bacterium]|uniref:Uncharacterized protein n=1 Tax=uncultured Cytophagales bacterium TaxID=158755 RepID=A0A6J4LP85_9SPHI|nr:MAG: hypothetical protein AVDCRST_MAG56-7770 [uncultured Cytophagales bacterium]